MERIYLNNCSHLFIIILFWVGGMVGKNSLKQDYLWGGNFMVVLIYPKIKCCIDQVQLLLFLVPGGTYFHLEPSHAVHARQSKY